MRQRKQRSDFSQIGIVYSIGVDPIYFQNCIMSAYMVSASSFLITFRLCKIFLHRLKSVIFCNFCRRVIFTTKFKDFYTFISIIFLSSSFMSVGWDVKWCPVSRITTTWHAKERFTESKLVRAARETSNCRRRYMAEILPIRRKTQSINLSECF